MITDYPEFCELSLAQRVVLHPMFQQLAEGISEFTFANLYLFRQAHRYRMARLPDGLFVFSGQDGDEPFFMLPFGVPEPHVLDKLFDEYGAAKAVSEKQAAELSEMGYSVTEDRDNFDYLYARADMAHLPGRKFHKKKNRVNAFIKNFEYEGEPLLEEHLGPALALLDAWVAQRDEPGDYHAAREGLEKMWELQLCGGIYYVESEPVAYSLGEELACSTSFVIHFEKAVKAEKYRGIYQFINQAFATILPDFYDTINREQDLGDSGLRQAKESYNPVGFVKKYRARKAD